MANVDYAVMKYFFVSLSAGFLLSFLGHSPLFAHTKLVCRELLHVLQNYYPERLGAAFIVFTPLLFSMVWKVIKHWLDQVTVSKVGCFSLFFVRCFFEMYVLTAFECAIGASAWKEATKRFAAAL